ncbi:MAG: deoxyribose-phosphate aldolase [Micrococcales bacterium]
MKYRGYTIEQIAKVIDHTVLKPTATEADIRMVCEQALKFDTASACIRPMDVKQAASILANSSVDVATVIGFPHGTTTTEAKVAESHKAIADGANELDMVLNISQLLDQKYDQVFSDIEAVVNAAEGKATVKVIFETCYLTDSLIARACELSEKAGAHFVKTSTGFATGGATIENIQLMRRSVGNRLGVKASGGIRTLDALIDMLEAGANRIGTSNTEAILAEFEQLAE